MNFENKKVFIAPHTPRTTMFQNALKDKFENIEVLGFLDNFKEEKGILKPNDLDESFSYDYILILSQNHFEPIYKEYKKLFPLKKIIKVDIKNEEYFFFDWKDIFLDKIKSIPQNIKLFSYKLMIKTFDLFSRKKIVFLSRSFISSNNKALYIDCLKKKMDVIILTDNNGQLQTLRDLNFPCAKLNSFISYFYLATAKNVIIDQGNSIYYLPYLSEKQKTIQLWHGVPLKRMNKLIGYKYDYFVGTSNFVNETSLGKVVQAYEYKDYGYPRNDLLTKEHDELDLLFCDKKLYELSKNNKIIVYMPTHRESRNDVPIDFKQLNKKMKELNCYFIVKFHPFVIQFYEEVVNSKEYSNILFHSIHGDIYPLLKYTDILISDYSSIYFDFLFVDKPLIFFDYDRKEYEDNIKGFVYSYDEYAPGKKVQSQNDLEKEIEDILKGNDLFKEDREKSLEKFFTHKDNDSSKRIVKYLLENNEK